MTLYVRREASPFSLRVPHLVVTAVLLIGIGPGARPALPQTPDTMSASLARVLAETADGFRDGRAHWIVADPHYPHSVSGVFPTFELARESVTRTPEYRVFGPFLTRPDFGRSGPIFLTCTHQAFPIASIMDPYCPGHPRPWADLKELSLLVRTERDTIRVDLLREGADALFLTASSIQKFVLPYYSRVYGPAYARALWDSVEARARRP